MSHDPMAITYLGDGVYARFDGYYLWLYTDNGVTKTHPVALEPQVYNHLVDYAAKHWNMNKNGKVEA